MLKSRYGLLQKSCWQALNLSDVCNNSGMLCAKLCKHTQAQTKPQARGVFGIVLGLHKITVSRLPMLTAGTHQEVVWFDISMQSVGAVRSLDGGHSLLQQKLGSVQAEDQTIPVTALEAASCLSASTGGAIKLMWEDKVGKVRGEGARAGAGRVCGVCRLLTMATGWSMGASMCIKLKAANEQQSSADTAQFQHDRLFLLSSHAR